MPRTRYRDDSNSNGATIGAAIAGALAGIALGVLLSHKLGGVKGIRERLRGKFGKGSGFDLDALRAMAGEAFADDPLDDEYDDDELEDDAADFEAAAVLEARVLAAFTGDAVFRERAVDIGAMDGAVIELSGWVQSTAERRRAAMLAREVPGVTMVLNELLVGDPETLDTTDLR